MSFKRWKDKQTEVNLYNGILLWNTKESIINTYISLDRSQVITVSEKKPISKLHTVWVHVYNIIFKKYILNWPPAAIPPPLSKASQAPPRTAATPRILPVYLTPVLLSAPPVRHCRAPLLEGAQKVGWVWRYFRGKEACQWLEVRDEVLHPSPVQGTHSVQAQRY